MPNCPKHHSLSIPWGTWHEDATLNLSFPKNWELISCPMEDSPPLSEEKIDLALQNPIGSNTLQSLAKNKQNIVIAVEDITRPSELETILQKVIAELTKAGVRREQITFLICNGAHAPMLRPDLEQKLGPAIINNYLVLNHNPYDNLKETGIFLGKTPVKINRYFLEADLRIAIGSIIPHNFAGFSSGGKLVLPGLSDIATLEWTHKFAMMGFRGGVNDVENNKFRLELEGVVSQIGLDFFIGIVPNAQREIAGVFVGDFIKAHRRGVDFARKVFRTEIPGPCDVAILNAYPKDSELLQAETALTPLKTIKTSIIEKNGVIIIISKCANGLGYHALFGPGMRLYHKPIQRKFLRGRDLILFSPNINQAEFHSLFWKGYQLINRWDTLLSLLHKRFIKQATAVVLPHAPLQLLEKKCS